MSDKEKKENKENKETKLKKIKLGKKTGLAKNVSGIYGPVQEPSQAIARRRSTRRRSRGSSRGRSRGGSSSSTSSSEVTTAESLELKPIAPPNDPNTSPQVPHSPLRRSRRIQTKRPYTTSKGSHIGR